MAEGKDSKLLWVLAVLLLVVGAGMAVNAGRRIEKSRKLLPQKIGYVRELQKMESEVRQFHDALRIFEQMPGQRPKLLDEVMGGTDLKYKVRAVPDAPKCIPGWAVRQKEVDLSESEVAIGKIMEFVARVEGESRAVKPGAAAPGTPQDPPWRLAKCILKSSSRTPGSADAILVFEALERTESK